MSDESQSGGSKPGILGKVFRALRKYFLILVVFVAVIIGLAFYTTRGVSSAGDTIISKIQNRDCDGIYAMAATSMKATTSAEAWDKACREKLLNLTGKVTQQSAEIEASTSGPKLGVVIYHVVGSNQATYKVTMQLTDEDGWKLNYLDSHKLEADSVN